MLILGIETSCDETSAAVVDHRYRVLSNVIVSQIKDHRAFGGVVPELASRRHMETISAVFEQSLVDAGVNRREIDAIVVTSRPGLVGALLVGVNFAKALSFSLQIPVLPVNHLAAHVYSVFIDNLRSKDLKAPFLALVLSGGHSILFEVSAPDAFKVVFQTVDDAIGEAFDKVAKLCGLPYPGGPEIERCAVKGDPHRFDLPTILPTKSDLKLSFSGLKTAVRIIRQRLPETLNERDRNDLCAGFQFAAVDLVLRKTKIAVEKTGLNQVVVCGGVASNGYLRQAFEHVAPQVESFFPQRAYSTDNGAMIAALGHALVEGDPNLLKRATFDFDATPSNRKGVGYL